MQGPKVHPRVFDVQRAGVDFSQFAFEWQKKYDLSCAEVHYLLNGYLIGLAEYEMKEDRKAEEKPQPESGPSTQNEKN